MKYNDEKQDSILAIYRQCQVFDKDHIGNNILLQLGCQD